MNVETLPAYYKCHWCRLCKCAQEFLLGQLKSNHSQSDHSRFWPEPSQQCSSRHVFGNLAMKGYATRRKQVSLQHRRQRGRQNICIKILVKERSEDTSRRAILLRASLIKKKDHDGSFYTQDARPLWYFLALCWHAIIFFLFFHSGCCVSPHWHHYLFISCFLASPVLGLLCCMSCCLTVWSCFQAPHAATSVSANRAINLQSHFNV